MILIATLPCCGKAASVKKTMTCTIPGISAAQNSRTEAQARIKSAKEQLSLKMVGPRKETIDQAKAQVQVATEALNQARQQEKYTEIFSPTDGIVLSKAAEPGEYLNPASPVLTIGDTAHPWLRAYIREKDLGRVRLNGKATVTTDAFPKKTYQGRISFLSSQAEFTPKTVQTFEERVKLMYRIKVQLENPDGELEAGNARRCDNRAWHAGLRAGCKKAQPRSRRAT